MEIVRDALHDSRDALKPSAGIDRRLGERHHRAILLPVKLHEHEVPDLEEATGFGTFHEGIERVVRDLGVRPFSVGILRERPVGGHVREIDVDLGARSTRTGVRHLPKVVLGAESVNTVVRYVGHVLPQLPRFVVFVKDGDTQMLTRNLQVFGDELPREADRIALEVIAEREVAEHLEKGVVTRRVADLFKVVVLASGTDTFLRRGRSPISIGGALHAEKDLLELDHPCVREKQGRIIGRNERRARADGVAILLEVGQESGADFGRKHRRENIDDRRCFMRGLLAVVFSLPTEHLTKHLPDDAAAESAALKERHQPAPEHGGFLGSERAHPLLRLCAARGQLVETVLADGRADRLVDHSPLDALPPKHLTDPGGCLTAPESRSGFSVRHVFIGEHPDGCQPVERLGNQAHVGLNATESYFKLTPGFPATSERVHGAIAEVRDRRFAAQKGHRIGIEFDARSCGAGRAEGGDRHGKGAPVGEREHEPPRTTRGFQHVPDRAGPAP